MYAKIIKPFFDITASLFLLIVLSPIFMAITILLIFINLGSPFFIQKRPGKNERIFSIIKFKTMTDKKDKYGVLLPDAKRLTKLGSFIRKTSLDEIPQLLNVLKGDMSLVGPRPLLVEYLDLYTTEQSKRHNVKPGITGWAQVNGRNAISWEEKFKLDVWYVYNQSFILDFKILLYTIQKVFLREGINTSGEATTKKFEGLK